MTGDTPLWIYAGSHQQANWVAEWLGLKRKQWRYLSEGNQLAGIRYPRVLAFGTTFSRPELEREMIKSALRVSEAKVMWMTDR